MGELLSLLILAFVVSLDSFTVGFTYGLRKVTIPFKSLVIISSCTFVVLMLAMLIGTIIERFISHEAAEFLGGLILIGLGIWVLYQFFTSQESKSENQSEYKIIKFELKSFSIIIKILRKPIEADFNRSGNINSMEALFLGLALSLDSFGAGVGAALIDLPPILFSFLITIFCTVFVIAGIQIGKILTNVEWMKKLTILPGIALIIIGILRM